MSHRVTTLSRRARQAGSGIRQFFDTGNLFRFLLSIVLAFGLWAFVTYQDDPETTRVLGGLTVSIQNMENDVELVGEPPTVDVTIQGPQSVVTPLERDNIVASVDMSEIEDTGEHELDVSINAPSDVRVREVAPETVTVEIELISDREDIPVTAVELDNVPPGYQVRGIEVESESVDVSGPARTPQ